jgi:hypothetical protein
MTELFKNPAFALAAVDTAAIIGIGVWLNGKIKDVEKKAEQARLGVTQVGTWVKQSCDPKAVIALRQQVEQISGHIEDHHVALDKLNATVRDLQDTVASQKAIIQQLVDGIQSLGIDIHIRELPRTESRGVSFGNITVIPVPGNHNSGPEKSITLGTSVISKGESSTAFGSQEVPRHDEKKSTVQQAPIDDSRTPITKTTVTRVSSQRVEPTPRPSIIELSQHKPPALQPTISHSHLPDDDDDIASVIATAGATSK